MNLNEINDQLRDQHPAEIVRWAIELDKKAILTTNFGPYEAAIIHMAVQVDPNIPVVWMDSGYSTEATYQFVQEMVERFKLNLKIYVPQQTAAYRNVVMNGIPGVDDPLHKEFTQQVKLEPFKRAMGEWKPEVWLTAIRKEQTAFRASLDVVTQDTEEGPLKVAPVFYWTEADLDKYLADNDLRTENDYYDPTKVLGDRECGLHTDSSGKLVSAKNAA